MSNASARRYRPFGQANSKSPRTAFALTLATGIIACAGCSDDSGKVDVHGQVTYRGQPVTDGTLTFFPTSGAPQSAQLGDGGAYELPLPPGDYRAIVTIGVTLPEGWKEGDPVPAPTLVLPQKYTSRARTELTAHVDEEATAPIDFQLE